MKQGKLSYSFWCMEDFLHWWKFSY